MFLHSVINLLTIPFRFAGLVTPFSFIQFIEILSSHELGLIEVRLGRIWTHLVYQCSKKSFSPFGEPCRWTLLHIFMMNTAYTKCVLFVTFQKRFRSYYFIFGTSGFLPGQVSSIHLMNPERTSFICVYLFTGLRLNRHAGLMFSFRTTCHHRSPMVDHAAASTRL